MSGRFNVRPAADRDLDNLADYLAHEAGLATAYRFLDAAYATFKALADLPGIGELRQSTDSRLAGLRVWRVEHFPNHLVFYRTSDPGIDIIVSCTAHATSQTSRMLTDHGSSITKGRPGISISKPFMILKSTTNFIGTGRFDLGMVRSEQFRYFSFGSIRSSHYSVVPFDAPDRCDSMMVKAGIRAIPRFC